MSTRGKCNNLTEVKLIQEKPELLDEKITLPKLNMEKK